MQLRSEVYDSMHLSTRPPPYDLEWVEDRYLHFMQCFPGVADSSPDSLESITQQLTLHSSMLFLLQPGILYALSQQDNLAPKALPIDSYISACKLIETYRKIHHATDSSSPDLVTYPITLLSVFSIWQAAMTLMAHCLLSIDGRISFFALGQRNSSHRVPWLIDYSNIFEISSSCLILLAWCAERWPGMEGTMDAYRRLSQRLLPELVQRGLFTAGVETSV